jgi:tetratricopeptide (TPR) repeat protein
MPSILHLSWVCLLSAALMAMGFASAQAAGHGGGGGGRGGGGMGGGGAAMHSGSGMSRGAQGFSSFGQPGIQGRSFSGSREAFRPNWEAGHNNFNTFNRFNDRGREFTEHRGDFDRGRFDRDFGRGRNWWWGGWGWGFPWYSYGWGYPWYSYDYGYPYYGYSGDVYNYSDNLLPYISAYAPSDQSTIGAMEGTSDYYNQALEAFRQGDYRGALRLAAHAAIDDPRDPSTHVLLSLAMFAVGDYRAAAMEAHGLAAMGRVPDWNTVYGFYGNVQPYTDQLRKLEDFVAKNPNAPEARFLLGFQYQIDGHREAAQGEYLQALTKIPQDRIAAQLLTQVGGKVPENIAQQQQAQGQQLGVPPNAEHGSAMGPGVPTPPKTFATPGSK